MSLERPTEEDRIFYLVMLEVKAWTTGECDGVHNLGIIGKRFDGEDLLGCTRCGIEFKQENPE